MTTPAQERLIAHLVERIQSDPDDASRRWSSSAELAQRYARDSQTLLLARDWEADLVLTRSGQVLVIDTERSAPTVPATERESRVALYRSIAAYPELLTLLPQRPVEGITCSGCDGAGVLELTFTKPALRNLLCYCAGAGWVLPGEVPAG